MSIFKRHHAPYNDFSTRLRDVRLWTAVPEVIRIETVNGICSLCVDTYSRLFAVGTSHGEIRIYDELFRETILVTPKATAVKILHFARPRDLFKLLCIDSNNVLHVWNLDAYGIPPLQASQPLDGLVYRVITCLSHSHALLATQSGEVVTFDLSSLRFSPYKIPYALGDREHSRVSGPAIDVSILPSKLQHILVGYEDGIVLYDLVSKKVLKTYSIGSSPETQIPPFLTTLAIHPLGGHFAAGYIDGSICIWDVQTSKHLWVGTADGTLKSSNATNVQREPIFKMEWTFLEGKDDSSSSWLTVLGGQRLSDDSHNYVSVLGLNPANFHVATADAASNMDLGRFLYPVTYPAQDFAIIPPKIGPAAVQGQILLLSGDIAGHNAALDAFVFPPELRQVPTSGKLESDQVVDLEFSAELEESKVRSRDLEATLEDLKGSSEDDAESYSVSGVLPASVSMPFQLLIGPATVLGADMITVNAPEYSRLARRPGWKTLASTEDRYRLLVTRHRDNSVRFYDVSALSDGGVDLSLHPHAMDHLTIRVLNIPEIALRSDIHEISVTGVTVSTESLECAVTLSTGEVVVLGLGLWRRTMDVMDDELIDLNDARDNGDVYTPRFILRAQNGGAAAVCLSDIGFLAVAFHHGLISIVDMRGPNIILRDGQDAHSKHGEANVAKSLYWAVSSLGDDSKLAPRLLALRQDGTFTTYTLMHPNGVWTVDTARTIRDVHRSLTAPGMSIVLAMEDGSSCGASPANLAKSMDSKTDGSSGWESSDPRSLWVAASRREIRCCLDITGDKVSKISCSSHDSLDHTSLVSAYGSSALVTVSRDQGVVFSLPLLEVIYTFRLPVSMQTSLSACCTENGDLLQTYQTAGAGFTLMFTSLLVPSRPLPSRNVNFRVHKFSKNAPPESATKTTSAQGASTWGSGVASWIKSFAEETSISGDEVDFLFKGPEVSDTAVHPATTTLPSHTSVNKQKKSAGSAANWGQGMYQQLTSAASERGERLGQLEEHFKSLEAGSKDMVAQAKKLAEKQAAKRWFL